MRKPIHTDQEIIQAGESLMSKFDREVSATDIHKALGGKGKYSRIRALWDAHKESREEEQEADIPLPEECQDRIAEAASSLQASMESLVRSLIVRMTEQNVRQSALRERDFALLEAEHAKHVQILEEEITYLTDCLDEIEAQSDDETPINETADPEPSAPSLPAPASAAVAQAAPRKSPNRPVKKTRPAARKAVRSSPAKPKKSPGQAQTPS
ncbi:hypothetical protein FDT80_06020 [Sulfitobacter sabulilitoris]|uniref:KfrA N-terminal DNA-binding domain-containing protein n=1 Tax=Sulfitobacter sabulilitoris TaxID=2562655 RepID=A0A5S3QD82_9RHOB|nr:hypothetical protein FDT80_06020 [Sulfitobacter sabulilitoris]